jgi:DNA-binding response OmpR family regulator
VIILSADATPNRVDDLLARGADRFLTKPIEVRELLAAVREHLDTGGMGEA